MAEAAGAYAAGADAIGTILVLADAGAAVSDGVGEAGDLDSDGIGTGVGVSVHGGGSTHGRARGGMTRGGGQ